MARMLEALTIGDLAERCGVSRDAIRFYEREGLLPRPRRSPAQYRLYGTEDEARLVFIRRAQGLGLTLDDVRELLSMRALRTPKECGHVAERLRVRIGALDKKIAELRSFRRQLAKALDRCIEAGSGVCPVVLDLAATRAEPRRK